MHKHLGWLLILLALAGGARAQGIGVGLGVDDVTLRPGGGGTGIAAPAVSLNFATGGYSNTAAPVCNSAATCLTTSNSGGMAVDASGIWHSFAVNTPRVTNLGLTVEESRTNLFLNSQAPATQTITVVSTSVYTVSVYGTASVVLSGAGTGTVTQGNPITFTASTTSLVCTVSGAGGTFQNVQVELGAFATTPIPTITAAVTRAADVIKLITVPTIGSIYTLNAAGVPAAPINYANFQWLATVSDGTNTNRLTFYRSSPSGTTQVGPSGTGGSGNYSFNGTLNTNLSIAPGTLVKGATTPTGASGLTALAIGADAVGSEQWDGTISSVALWPTTTTALTAAQLQALTH